MESKFLSTNARWIRHAQSHAPLSNVYSALGAPGALPTVPACARVTGAQIRKTMSAVRRVKVLLSRPRGARHRVMRKLLIARLGSGRIGKDVQQVRHRNLGRARSRHRLHMAVFHATTYCRRLEVAHPRPVPIVYLQTGLSGPPARRCAELARHLVV